MEAAKLRSQPKETPDSGHELKAWIYFETMEGFNSKFQTGEWEGKEDWGNYSEDPSSEDAKVRDHYRVVTPQHWRIKYSPEITL